MANPVGYPVLWEACAMNWAEQTGSGNWADVQMWNYSLLHQQAGVPGTEQEFHAGDTI